MEILELRAAARTEKGKGPAGRLRREGRVPAVVYGEKAEAIPVSVDSRELHAVMSAEAGATSIVKLVIDGDQSSTAMIKEVQRDSMRDTFVHVDFLKISMNVKITTHVGIAIVGEAAGVKEGGVLQQVLREVEVEALPMELPEHIEIDVSELNIGDSARVSDLAAPSGVAILTNPEDMLLSVVPPAKIEEVVVPVEEELEEGEVAEVGEEGEAGAEEASGDAQETSGE